MAELVFDWNGARAERFSVVPTLTLSLRISETTGQSVDAIALRCQIRIEPQRRRYSGTEAERLHDLFGDTTRWADTLKPLQFAMVSVMVPGFSGSTEIDLPVPISYDMEIASTRYLASLDDGEVPLLLLFSGTVFAIVDGRLQVQQVPWSKETSCRPAGPGMAGGGRRALPGPCLGHDEPRDARRADPLQDPSCPADLGCHAAGAPAEPG